MSLALVLEENKPTNSLKRVPLAKVNHASPHNLDQLQVHNSVLNHSACFDWFPYSWHCMGHSLHSETWSLLKFLVSLHGWQHTAGGCAQSVLFLLELKLVEMLSEKDCKYISTRNSEEPACHRKFKVYMNMFMASLAVGAIEASNAVELTFVSPIYLQLGVPVNIMTLCWIINPILGLFLVPILGGASDGCRSPLGKRRPFIIIYAACIAVGLLLVPYGKTLGELLGDHDLRGNVSHAHKSNSSSFEMTYTTTSHPPLKASFHIAGKQKRQLSWHFNTCMHRARDPTLFTDAR